MDLSTIPVSSRAHPGSMRPVRSGPNLGPTVSNRNRPVPAGPALKTTPICIVDDDAGAAESLASLIDHAGLGEAMLFADPLPALEWCLARRPALVLVEEALPGLGGLEFTAKLRVAAPGGHTVVGLLSHRACPSLHDRARAAGAADVIAKPLSDCRVVGQLQSLLALTRPQGPDWEATIAQAAALTDRAVCREPALVLPALRGCAQAYGLRIPHCDVLEDAWRRLCAASQGLPPRSDLAGFSALGSRRRALRALALAERERSTRQSSAGGADPGLWAAQMLLYGNEHWDGGGPAGLRGAEIPVPARLFHLVNSYALLRVDATAGGAALSGARARRLLHAWSGAEFDPDMVAGLLRTPGA
jgi:FixJ family two-component response regulator